MLRRTHHLEQAQQKLVASEKLAVLGSLAAGVAHELNTPLAALQSAGQTVAGFFSGALDGEIRVRGAREGLAQVWLNLANNALQSMNARGTLTIDARRQHDRVIVLVRDTGPGIPAELADQVFTPFFTTKKDTGGLGLGLDICRKIVESNLGTISFQSSPGNTVFSVELPAATF